MKNILVPTDFSACASYATDAALQFGRRFAAKVHLLHLLGGAGDDPEAITQAAHNAQVLYEDIKQENKDVAMCFEASPGRLIDEVNSYVKQHGIDLIIMGSHGLSGKNEYFIGSNTQKVVRRVSCPVLVVKNPFKLDLERVAFAAHFFEEEKDAFLRFKEFIMPFLPEVHLVEIYTSSLFSPPTALSVDSMQRFEALCAPLPCKIHIQHDFSVEQGVREFAENIGAQLICISNHVRRPLKRMLVGSNVEALINHTEIPVLSMDWEG